jgi:alkyl sulfatase BDS1-like metallo-beta-lactamase superfamily hydrolase
MSQAPYDEPPLARIVREGAQSDGSTDATPVTDTIFLSPGVSNSYLLTTLAGPVLINAGSAQEAERAHAPRYRRICSASPVFIVTTQSHRDHIGGVPVLAGPETQWIAHRGSTAWRADVRKLLGFFTNRRNVLWSAILDTVVDQGSRAGPDREPEIFVDDFHAFELGGRRFELLAVPGGETTESLAVWLPAEKTVFTGNFFGPLFGHLPNLYTLRGDKIRSAMQFVRSLERMRALRPELLVTGHCDPIRGADRIQAELMRIRDAVQFIHDRTIEGMNRGVDLLKLMREVTLPDTLALPQTHGKVSWCVRAIWEEHAGWFRMEATTELYPVPLASVAPDLVTAAGADVLVGRARTHIEQGRAVEALHLIDIVLHACPDDAAALEARQAALELLHAQAGGVNLSEVTWLRSEIKRTQDRRAHLVASQ